MRRGGRKDTNHADIRDGLRDHGYRVLDTSDFGDGFADLVVGHKGRNIFLEVKAPGKSKRGMRPKQVAFRDAWPGQYAVVETLAEAVAAIESP